MRKVLIGKRTSDRKTPSSCPHPLSGAGVRKNERGILNFGFLARFRSKFVLLIDLSDFVPPPLKGEGGSGGRIQLRATCQETVYAYFDFKSMTFS